MGKKKVNFDQGLASSAVTALTTLRTQLTGFQRTETPPRNHALDGWTGPYADEFQQAGGPNGWIPGDAANLATAIGLTIKAIEDGAAAAKAKNAG